MVKFLLVYNVYITLYSFNTLLAWYSSLLEDGIEDKRINTHNGIWVFEDIREQDNLLLAYKKKDEDNLKELLFGKRCKDEVELYYGKADIGISSSGSIVTVENEKDVTKMPSARVGAFDRHLRYGHVNFSLLDFDTKTVIKYSSTDGSLMDSEIEKLKIKMALANQSLKEYKYDLGWVSLADTPLNLDDYIHVQDFTIKNKSGLKMHDITMVNMILYKLDNFSINHMVDSVMRKIEGCTGRINHMIFVDLDYIQDSEVIIDNVANMTIGRMESSHIIFNESVYKLSAYNSFKDTTLEFNCDIDEDSLHVGGKIFKKCTFIFRRNVKLESLLQLCTKYGEASIQVNPDIYTKCKQDERFKGMDLGLVKG